VVTILAGSGAPACLPPPSNTVKARSLGALTSQPASRTLPQYRPAATRRRCRHAPPSSQCRRPPVQYAPHRRLYGPKHAAGTCQSGSAPNVRSCVLNGSRRWSVGACSVSQRIIAARGVPAADGRAFPGGVGNRGGGGRGTFLPHGGRAHADHQWLISLQPGAGERS